MAAQTNLFLVFLTLAIGVMNIFAEAIQYFELTRHAGLISILTSLALLALPWIGMRVFQLKLTDFHITWLRKPKQTFLETGALLFISLLVAWVIFGVKAESRYLNYIVHYFSIGGLVAYIVSACIQEYVFRGVFLDLILRSGLGNFSLHAIVLFTSVLFSVTHEIWGFPAMVFTLFGNIILSYLYAHQKCLFGVCVLHSVYGILVFPLIGGV